jgi:hypothetical protein
VPSLTLEELGDTRQVKAWIDAGEMIELRDGSELVGRILPVTKSFSRGGAVPPYDDPDFGAETRAIFGDRILPGADLLIEEREKSRF